MTKYIGILLLFLIHGIYDNSSQVLAEKIENIKDIKLHNLPIKKNNKKSKINQIELKPIPLPLIEIVSKSVNSERNPFAGLIKNTELIGIKPNKFFSLKGLVQINNQLNAMLQSSDGLSIFKNGDFINKDLQIKEISIEDESVVVSDGENEFILYFEER